MHADSLDTPHDHPSEQVLGDFAVGRIVGDLAVRIGDHLKLCAACSAKAAALATDALAAHDSLTVRRALDSPAGQEEVAAEPLRLNARFGRYIVQRKIGQGAFGAVYLAFDPELKREVALKTPRPDRFHTPDDLQRFLSEARTVAALSHPGIVAIYDVLQEGNTIGIAQEYVAGFDLANWAAASGAKLDDGRIATLLADVADAVAFAHQQGLVHRDLKPPNILLDAKGRPRVADFGLALHDRGRRLARGEQAGTPVYMSPEQIRGESHRMDGRSDIWSLGVILYELLAGCRPFHGDSPDEVFAEILEVEPRPPRQFDPQRSAELERICLKCLSKRIGDRYTTAADLASELRNWQPVDDETKRTPTQARVESPDADSAALVAPKGLRSFDAEDAACFLDLLPGPRGRDSLPESVRFWKLRLEAKNAEHAFGVGLLYGPSGCGKSSLMKAGLLPLLAPHVVSVYLEATAGDLEQRLLQAIRRQAPDLPSDLDLATALEGIRAGSFLAAQKKLVLVIDQFEQWLHARGNQFAGPLVAALRQCDGERVQAVLMVRDDFWLAISRFMHELEVDLIQGKNLGLVDLFDMPHAERVLTKFGQALGRLPLPPQPLNLEQQEFLKAAIQALAEDGKIIPVRLSLFTEMVKGQAWTKQTFQQLGGIRGLGIQYFEHTFSARPANPRHRAHQVGARKVLAQLLPEVGTQIKGQMQRKSVLLEASGYQQRPADFDDLLRILDSDLRLITPAQPGAVTSFVVTGPLQYEEVPMTTEELVEATNCYQLTHDYLVPLLREWLTLKQRETARGRAELVLAERSTSWNLQTQNRLLPSLPEFLRIIGLTRYQNWTYQERRMLRQASWYHGIRVGLALLLFTVAIFTGSQVRQRMLLEREKAQAEKTHIERSVKAQFLVMALRSAETPQISGIIEQLAPVRELANLALENEFRFAPENSARKLHAALALFPVDRQYAGYLRERLLTATPAEFVVIRDALRSPPGNQAESLALRDLLPSAAKDQIEPLWVIVNNSELGSQARLRAACALATNAPDDERWAKVADSVALWLAAENSLTVTPWIEALRPVGPRLFEPLRERFLASQNSEEKLVIASAIAEFGKGRPAELVELVRSAEMRQVPLLVRPLTEQPEEVTRLLLQLVSEEEPGLNRERLINPPAVAKENGLLDQQAKRRARALVALLTLGQGEHVWPALRSGPDPRLRTYLIDQLRTANVDPEVLVCELSQPHEPAILQGILLALGEYSPDAIRQPERLQIRLRELLADSNLTIRSGAEWLCTEWRWSLQPNETDPTISRNESPPSINAPHGHALAVIAGPIEFNMGLSYGVNFPEFHAQEHARWIGRSYAIASRETTRGQFRKFLEARGVATHPALTTHFTPSDDCPVAEVTWFEAAAYCNWLSKEAGLPESEWCFLPNAQGEYAAGMKHAPNYLRRIGFRLPTEAEWEYACSGGANGAGGANPFHFGGDETLLVKYGWHVANSPNTAQPVARLRPNPFGLFDMHGNVVEWCSDGPADYPATPLSTRIDQPDEPEMISDADHRSVRGGQFPRDATHLFTTRRRAHVAAAHYGGDGFRVVRTAPTPQLVVFDSGQQVQQQASLKIVADSAPLEIFDLHGGIDVQPRSGPSPLSVKITGAGLEPREFSFRIRRSDNRALSIVRGKFSTGQLRLHTYELNKLETPLIHLPAGEFLMGSTPDEIARFSSFKTADDKIGRRWIAAEGPQHRVQISQPFRMSATEVTNREFESFVNETGYKTQAETDTRQSIHLIDKNWKLLTPPEYSWRKPHYPSGPNQPVVNVTWNDAQAYCQWLSKLEGEAYSLPTEAQWEYAARAGTTTPYFFGPDDSQADRFVWFNGNYTGVAQVVGKKEPNPWGLFDLYGNVDEWCQDLFHHQYYEDSPQADPSGAAENTDGRSLRGGWAFAVPFACRSAARHGDDANHRSNFCGFRVVAVARKPAIEVSVVGSQVVMAQEAEHQLQGSGERFRLQNVRGDVLVEPQSASAPTTLRVRALDRSLRTYEFDVVNEETQAIRTVRGVLLFPEWRLRYFAWPANPAKVLELPAEWQKVLASPLLAEQPEQALSFFWGDGSPQPQVPADYFAIEADCNLELPAGELEIRAQADDGLQFYIDDQPIEPAWFHAINKRVPVAAGVHQLRISYAEANATAALQVNLRLRLP